MAIKGTLARPSGDWFVRRMMNRNAYQPSVTGQYAYLGVYNNASDGSVIYIQALRFTHLSITDTAFVGTIQQNLLVSPAPGLMLDPTAPQGPGLMGAFPSATDLLLARYGSGGASAELGSHDRSFYDWPYDFPVAVVPPTWCCILQSHSTSDDLGAAFWWYAVKR